MSWLSKLFGKKEPEKALPPRTRQEMEENEVVAVQKADKKGKLQTVFEKQPRDTAKKQQLTEMLDMIVAAGPEYKKLVDDVAALGIELHLDALGPNNGGGFVPDKKCITVNTSLGLNAATMAAIMVHEMNHAAQDGKSSLQAEDNYQLTAPSFLKKFRAMEGGAKAEEMKFVHRVKDAHPEVLDFYDKTDDYKTFKTALETAKSEGLSEENAPDKAAAVVFKEWNNVWGNAYSNAHGAMIYKASLYGCKKMDKKTMTQEPTDKETLDIALPAGSKIKDYIEDGFLSSAKMMSVSPDLAATCEQREAFVNVRLNKQIGRKQQEFVATQLFANGSDKTLAAANDNKEIAVAALLKPEKTAQKPLMSSLKAIDTQHKQQAAVAQVARNQVRQ